MTSLIDIKSLIFRVKTFTSKMPLAREEGLVSGSPERFGNGDFLKRKFIVDRWTKQLSVFWTVTGYPVGYIQSGRMFT